MDKQETPNQTLQRCKDTIAKMMGFKDFLDYVSFGITGTIIPTMEDVARLYHAQRILIEQMSEEK